MARTRMMLTRCLASYYYSLYTVYIYIFLFSLLCSESIERKLYSIHILQCLICFSSVRGLLLPHVGVERFGVERTDAGNLGSGIYFSDAFRFVAFMKQPEQ